VNAAAVSPEALGGKEYTVVRGDSFAKIAKTQGSTVAAIKQANPTVDPVKIRPGMKLIVPTIAPASSTAAKAATGAQGAGGVSAAGAPAGTYVVKSGDTLTRIAKNHGVTVSQLREANHLRTSRVNVGQKLKIPAGKVAAPTNQAAAPSPSATF
jgi:peptidoglycan endopeptidase LytE